MPWDAIAVAAQEGARATASMSLGVELGGKLSNSACEESLVAFRLEDCPQPPPATSSGRARHVMAASSIAADSPEVSARLAWACALQLQGSESICDGGAMVVAVLLTAMAGPAQGLLQAHRHSQPIVSQSVCSCQVVDDDKVKESLEIGVPRLALRRL